MRLDPAGERGTHPGAENDLGASLRQLLGDGPAESLRAASGSGAERARGRRREASKVRKEERQTPGHRRRRRRKPLCLEQSQMRGEISEAKEQTA